MLRGALSQPAHRALDPRAFFGGVGGAALGVVREQRALIVRLAAQTLHARAEQLADARDGRLDALGVLDAVGVLLGRFALELRGAFLQRGQRREVAFEQRILGRRRTAAEARHRGEVSRRDRSRERFLRTQLQLGRVQLRAQLALVLLHQQAVRPGVAAVLQRVFGAELGQVLEVRRGHGVVELDRKPRERAVVARAEQLERLPRRNARELEPHALHLEVGELLDQHLGALRDVDGPRVLALDAHDLGFGVAQGRGLFLQRLADELDRARHAPVAARLASREVVAAQRVDRVRRAPRIGVVHAELDHARVALGLAHARRLEQALDGLVAGEALQRVRAAREVAFGPQRHFARAEGNGTTVEPRLDRLRAREQAAGRDLHRACVEELDLDLAQLVELVGARDGGVQTRRELAFGLARARQLDQRPVERVLDQRRQPEVPSAVLVGVRARRRDRLFRRRARRRARTPTKIGRAHV